MIGSRSCRLAVSLLILGTACTGNSGSGSEREDVCGAWSDSDFQIHHDAIEHLWRATRSDIDTSEVPHLTDDAVQSVDPYSRDLFRDEYRACASGGLEIIADVQAPGEVALQVRGQVIVFESWKRLEWYVDNRSSASQAEAFRRTSGAPSPIDDQVRDLGGDPYRTTYCLIRVGEHCSIWNLIVVLRTCRAIALDLELSGFYDDRSEATRVLAHIADAWEGILNDDASALRCELYTGDPAPYVWSRSQ